MAIDDAAIIDLGKLPISEAEPCGKDAADDEEYLLIDAEMTKLDRIDLGEVDWPQVELASQNILHTKSKDVEMACALGYALVKRERYAGLAATLGLFTELVKTFWETLFPKRPRRRKARMEALAEHLIEAGWLSDEGRPRPDEFDAVDLCVERIEELTAALKEAMPDDEPDFGKFTRKIKELAKGRPKPAEPAPAAEGAAS
ncbi:MAG: type VI secretion system ImpA family N-terminal domain-containing protein, partial [Phycisphaerae bacterium]|nr:type VI secretion system ImpA family N-terminal domain-containing protein [Phycisphaerae bacterium]